MLRKLTLPAMFTAGLLLAGCASLSVMEPAKTRDGVLVGANDMTLYTFDKDTTGSGKSVCNDACARNWPPLMATAGSSAQGGWSIVNRDDGSKQWAYRGKPVYFWAKDKMPGDKTGDGVGGAWHTARP